MKLLKLLFFQGYSFQSILGLIIASFICTAVSAEAQTACAFVNDNFPNANTVEGYRVTATNAFHLGPVATGGDGSPTNDPTFFGTPLIAIAPGTTHLYAANSATSDIAFFNFDSLTCVPTFVAKFPSGGTSLFGLGITVSPDGKFLYATNADRQSTLMVFPVNSDGTLGASVQTVSLSANPSTVAITPNGKLLILTMPGVEDQVQSYVINPASGELTFVSSVNTIAAADGVAIDPHSSFIYVGNGGEGGSSAIQIVKIGPGGQLTYVANVVFNGIDNPVGIRGGSNCLLMSPNGRLLFFTNQVDASVVSLNVNPQSGNITFNSQEFDGRGVVDEPSQIAGIAARSLLFTGDFNTHGQPAMGVLHVSAQGVSKLLAALPLAPNAAATSIAVQSF